MVIYKTKRLTMSFDAKTMESEKEIQKIKTQEEFESDELLSGKALEDDLELNEELDRLPI